MRHEYEKYAGLRETMSPLEASRALGYRARNKVLEYAFQLEKYEVGTVALWVKGEISNRVIEERYESLPSTIEGRQAGEMFYHAMGKLWEGGV